MAFHTDNPTFAQHVAQTLVIRGLGFTFYRDPGEFIFLVRNTNPHYDTTISLIRKAGEDWGVIMRESQDTAIDM